MSDDIPLYNYPLPEIETWLRGLGCEQDRQEIHCWLVERPHWQAQICLDVEELSVRYLQAGADGKDIVRSFKYSLTRSDIESAVFDGP
jgi:hypothetical protein